MSIFVQECMWDWKNYQSFSIHAFCPAEGTEYSWFFNTANVIIIVPKH